MAPPRTGRPKSDDPRNHVVSVRLTTDDHAHVSAAAEAAGKPISEWMRQTALRAAKRARPTR